MITINQASNLIKCLHDNEYSLLNEVDCMFSAYTKEIIWNDKSHTAVVVFDYTTTFLCVHFMLIPCEICMDPDSKLLDDVRCRIIDQYQCTSYHLVRDYEEVIKVFNMFNINVPEIIDAFAYIQARFGEALRVLDTYQIYTTAYHITISKDLDKFVFIFHNSKELSSYELDLTIDNIDTIEYMIINDD